MPRRGVLRSPDTRSCLALAYRTGIQTLPPARLFSSWVLQDHPYEMVDARVWRMVKYEARESPVRFLEHSPIRRGSGGPQKPFSSLSEGLRGMFTINTETGEKTCVPPPRPRDHHVLVGHWCGRISLRNFTS